MSDLKHKSKRLSWLLRHGANEVKLAMDTAGFASIAAVLKDTHLSRAELDEVVAENNKARFEIRGDQIRACQGHSLEGTPVTLEGLEATWHVVTEQALVFHGTDVAAARSIVIEGIKPAARTHVHLAPSEDAKVGKRAGVDVLLAISPPALAARGLRILRAPNGVLLARQVPRDAIVEVRAGTKAGERALAELRALLSG
jgi:putative RNA 2'-phosphotransferase